MEGVLELVVSIGIITLLFIVIHPFYWRIEGFADETAAILNSNTPIIHKFDNLRWSGDQVREFRQNISSLLRRFNIIQEDLQLVLKEYRSIEGELLDKAKKTKKEIQETKQEDLSKIKPEIREKAGITTDPVESYYRPFINLKKQNVKILPLAVEKNNPVGLEYELPQIVLPNVSLIADEESYKWMDMIEGEEKYKQEEKFYSEIVALLPTINNATKELYNNSAKLRISAGSKTYSLLPRVEAMAEDIRKQEKSMGIEDKSPTSKEDNSNIDAILVDKEWFEDKKQEIIKIYKGIEYAKWGINITNEIKTRLEESTSLLDNAQRDIQTTKRILAEIKRKGDEKRRISRLE